ncbi:hypothetical protein FNF31_04308 [Cafeteria roenbergensis]|uniref:Guanylate cyclase domain-containing protein n=1 Tax=Cafeteria roenbergensis TaxID=33653 RepID=A0A5A8D674_CAFRO|nr:hypothetical protein FNF31_04308 [Cafeteria roenbergensis]
MNLVEAEPSEVWIGPAAAGRSAAQGTTPNAISTAKYSPWLFIPQCLVEQFYRTANVYFLAIAVVQIVTDLSPTNQYSTLVPLLAVILLSMAKEGVEDWRRHSADSTSNKAPVRVLRAGGWAVAERQEIRPGDIVEVRTDEQFPADLVILATSAPDGRAMVDMSSLTGQERCAVRSAVHLTQGLSNDASRLAKLSAGVVMVAPSADLGSVHGQIHVWPDGTMPPKSIDLSTAVDVPWSTVTTATGPVSMEPGKWTTEATPGAAPAGPVSGPASAAASGWVAERAAAGDSPEPTQVLVGGDDVTAARFGLDGHVVEAVGTKRFAPRGSELRVTSFVVGVAVFTGPSTKMALCSGRARSKRGRMDAEYLTFLGETRGATDVSRAFVTILILYNNLVPISLYVTLEIVRWFQARRIEGDPHLRSAQGDAPVARTSSLNEDLGEVDFVFVDKTGTLTDNKMECHAVVIDGVRFGKEGASPAVSSSSAAEAGADAPAGPGVATGGEVSMTPERGIPPAAMLFFYGIALCHSVTSPSTPTTSVSAAAPAAPSLPPWRLYRSTSPDERALLLAARAMGFGFIGRQGNKLVLEVMGQVETWGLIHTHPFSSTRRIMSIVVRSPTGQVFVFAKGADSAMLPRLYNSDVARREAARAGPLPTVHSAEASMAEPSHSSDGVQPAYVDGFAGSDGLLSPIPHEDSFHVRSGNHHASAASAAIDPRMRGRLAASPALLPPAVAAGSLLEGGSSHGALDEKERASAGTRTPQTSAPSPQMAPRVHVGHRSRTSSSPEGRGLHRPGSASSVYRPGSASAAADPLPSMGINATSDARVKLESSIADLWEAGLRTMVVAARQLTAAEEEAWRRATRTAAAASGRKNRRLMQKAADLVEFGLVGLGATGVHHQLQEGVPETVETLRQSGCRVWMVTGDNEEPAISVAHAAGMIREASTIVALNGDSRSKCEHQLATARAELRSKGRWHPRLVDDGLVCVINGEALSHILAPSPKARRAEHEEIAQRHRRQRLRSGATPADIDEESDSSSDSDDEAAEEVVGSGASSRSARIRRSGGLCGRAGCCRGSKRRRANRSERVGTDSHNATDRESTTPDTSVATGGTPAYGNLDGLAGGSLDDPSCVAACFCASRGCFCCCCAAESASSLRAGRRTIVRQVSEGAVSAGDYSARNLESAVGATSTCRSEDGGHTSQPTCRCCSREWVCCHNLGSAHGRLFGSSNIDQGTFMWWLLHPVIWFPQWLTAALGISDVTLEAEPLPRERRLLELLKQCRTVLACSMTPAQKAQLVATVKSMVSPGPVTVAIGDGSNDVAMIREAHVGIGVTGGDCTHAVRSADFSVPTFKTLAPLMLTHGRQNKLRTSLTILYSFFKNVTLVFTLLLFSNLSGYSGTTLYESYLGAGWNVAWTFFPILAIGIFDSDLSRQASMRYPIIYRQIFRGAAFSVRSLAWWVVQGVLYAGVVTLASYAMFEHSWVLSDGTAAGIWPTGAVVNLILVVLVSGKLVIHMHSWCFATLGSVLLSFLLWFAFVIVYSVLYTATGLSATRDFSSVALVLMQQPLTWLGLLLLLGTALALELATHHLLRQVWPTSLAILQEWDKGLGTPESGDLVARAAEAHRSLAIAKERSRALKKVGGGYMLLQQSKWYATEQMEAIWDVEAMGDAWRPSSRKARASTRPGKHRHVIIGRLQGASNSGAAEMSVTGGKVLSMEEHLRQVAAIERLTSKVVNSQRLLWNALHKRWTRRRDPKRPHHRSSRDAAHRTAAVAPAAAAPVPISSGPVPQAPQLPSSGQAARSSDGMKLSSFHASDEPAASHVQRSSRGLTVPAFVARQRLAFATPAAARDSTVSRASDQRRTSAIEQSDGYTHPQGSGTTLSHRPGQRQKRGSVVLAPAWTAGSEGQVLARASRAGGAQLRQHFREMQQAKASGAEGLALSLEDSAAPRVTRFTRQFADDPELERAYHFRFFLGKSLPVTRTGLLMASALGGAFIIYEYFASVAGFGGFARRPPAKALTTLLLRMALVVGALLAVLFTYTTTFRRNHNSIMFALLLITGIAKTVIVSDAGTFGQTLYTICVLLILRLSFASAAVLAILDLAIFTAAVGANLVGDGVASLIDYIPYAAFVLAFGLSGALAIDEAMRQDFLQQARLAAEKKSFNDILKSSMPPHVTKKLKRMELGGFRGKYYDKEEEISVIFIDVIDFEKVTSSHTPQMMVTLLDRLWRLFDALVEKHLVTKMETVGKTYMACAGLQKSRSDHAAALVMLGLDILHNLRSFKDKDGRRIISVKIGIHSGPVVSGVAGLKKQQFSLFGDTVNTSSRMQSSGEPNRIHISPATYALVEGLFETEARRTPVKSKGIMITHLVQRVANSDEAMKRRRASALGLAPLLAGPSSQATGAAARAAATRAAALAVAQASPGAAASGRQIVAVAEAEPARPSARLSRHGSKTSRSESPGQLAKRTPSRTSLPMGVQRMAITEGKLDSAGDLAGPSEPHLEHVDSPSAADAETPRAGEDGSVTAGTQPEAESRRRESRFSIVNWLYVFRDKEVERAYQVKRRRSQLSNMRTAGLVLGLFAIFRVLWDDRASERSRILRVACAASMFVAASLTASKIVRRIPPALRHSMVALLFAVAGCLLAAAQANSAQVTLDIVFFTSLCSASGAVHHLGALFANLVVVSFALGISATNSLDFAGGDSLTGTAAFFAGIGVVAGTLASATRAYYKRRRFGLEVLTKEETKRAHGILYNMLPAALVNQIKEGKQGASDAFRNVTLLFCDIRGFTKMASSVSPEQVVDVLDKLFCSLDAITDQYEVFKVQTIGDAYVMVAGMPFKDQRVLPDSSAAASEAEALPSATSPSKASLSKTTSKLSMLSSGPGGASMGSMVVSSYGQQRFGGSSGSISSSMSSDGDAFVEHFLKQKADAAESNAASTFEHASARTSATNAAQLSTAGSHLLAPSTAEPAHWGRTRLHADSKRASKDVGDMDSSHREGNNSSNPVSSVELLRQQSDATMVVSDWSDEDRKVLDEAEAAGIEDPEYRAQHPRRRETAEAMVNVAMDMLQAIKKIKHPGTGEPLVMRIGLHTGDIVGGVIGSKTLRYDIWGTDVLVANKMESEGIPGGLVVSHDTRLALIGVENLEFRPHKDVVAKGRGTIKTFQVIKKVKTDGGMIRIGDVELDGDGHGGELDALRQQATEVMPVDAPPSDGLEGPSALPSKHGSPVVKSP